MPNFVVSAEWTWQNCTIPIKKMQKNPKDPDQQIVYQIISNDIETNEDNTVKICFDKDFPFEKNIGFIWHKSWNLPLISVTIQNSEMSKLRKQYDQIKCEIMAVFPVKQNKFYYLQEIKLNKENAVFDFAENSNKLDIKFIKFGATSFNYNRTKFCLLILIQGVNKTAQHDIYSFISSPVYVDSRKEARKKTNKPFNPLISQTPKKFFAPIGSRKNSQFNAIEGFLSYFGAQNIRNKIKHYFYLAFHFDKVFKLYRNKNVKMELGQILEAITVPNQLYQNLVLLVVDVQGERQKKKVQTMLEKWKFYYVEIMFGEIQVSKKWQPISKDQIRLSYKLYYEQAVIKDSDFNQKQELDQYDDYDEEGGEKKSIQRVFELRTVIEINRKSRVLRKQEYS